MTERQFEGRSVAEAAIKACEVLGLTRSALHYKVISETGELMERRVVIAVEASSVPAPSQAEAAPRAPRAEAEASEAAAPDDSGDGPSSGGDESGERRARRPAGRRSEGRSDSSSSSSRDRGPRSSSDRGGERNGRRSSGDRPARSSSGGDRGGRSRGGRDRDRDRPRAQDDDGIEALLKLDAQPQTPVTRRPSIEATTPRGKRALTVAGDLVRLMGLQLKAQLVQEQDAELHVDLVGADENRAIGRKGEVLLALQFVTNRIISRGEEEGDQVVVLDSGGYRERRRTALEQLATRLATRALQERKAVRLSPMSAHDRRVFHLTLKEIEGVTTRSEGDGLFRNLLIIPSEFV